MRTTMRAARRLAAVAAVIALGAILALALEVVRALAPRAHGAALGLALRVWSRAGLAAVGLRRRVEGVPAPGGVLVAANHVSWLDVLALGAEHGGGFVAKAEVARWPVLGALAARADTLFLRRGEPDSATAVAGSIAFRLRAGRSVVLFPEGTTTDGRGLAPFRHRLLRPAIQAQALVQPVTLAYAAECRAQAAFVGDDAFLPHLLRLARMPRLEVVVRYGRPRAAVGDPRALAEALACDVGAGLGAEGAVTVPSQNLHRLVAR